MLPYQRATRYMIMLRYIEHVQPICSRNFDEDIISIQALVAIWHAALHEVRDAMRNRRPW